MSVWDLWALDNTERVVLSDSRFSFFKILIAFYNKSQTSSVVLGECCNAFLL